MAGSAAERAAEVVLTSMLEAINHRLNGATVTTEDEARWVVDALMADPDLLVDLAIEAGGLRAVRPTTVHIGWAQERFTVTADPGTVQVLYRRLAAELVRAHHVIEDQANEIARLRAIIDCCPFDGTSLINDKDDPQLQWWCTECGYITDRPSTARRQEAPDA